MKFQLIPAAIAFGKKNLSFREKKVSFFSAWLTFFDHQK
jgi:hypothetical protein